MFFKQIFNEECKKKSNYFKYKIDNNKIIAYDLKKILLVILMILKVGIYY